MNFLEKIAEFQYKYKFLILILVIILTVFFAYQTTKIEMQTDLSKNNPEDLDIIKLNEKIDAKFGGQDIVVLLIRFDKSSNFEYNFNDIRDPQVINYIGDLENEFKKENSVENIISASTYFNSFDIDSLDKVKQIQKMNPQISEFFSKDYKTTVMYITSDLGGSQDKTIKFTEMINDKLEQTQKPSGIEVLVTGSAPVSSTLFDILKKDAIYTLIIAAIIIFLLLIILEKSFLRGLMIFLPILLGVIWTMGTMGLFNLKLSIATVGIGAMILGLGVEYGVFMHTRYVEEKNKKKGQLSALKTAIPSVGSAILGSGTTTIVGFLALSFSIMPILRDLGQSLAIGIAYSLFIAVFVSPTLIILLENFGLWLNKTLYKACKKGYKGEDK